MRLTLLCTCACATANALALSQIQRLPAAAGRLQEPLKDISTKIANEDVNDTATHVPTTSEVNPTPNDPTQDSARLPGTAGFTHCDPNIPHDTHLFQIASLDIHIEPITTGQPLSITLTGTLTAPLTPRTLLLTSHTINGRRQHTQSSYLRERLQSSSLLSWASAPAARMVSPADFAAASDEEVEEKLETLSEGKWNLVLNDPIENEAEGGEYHVRYRAVTEGWREVFCFEGRIIVEKVNRLGREQR